MLKPCLVNSCEDFCELILNSMGLIKLRENQAIVSCQLYQKYFISQYTGSV
ncbi:AAA-like domain-containing protein [Microcystis sp.]|uniref:AAA-like domain-containing protein n=1 Tax=Microcystis sp. TaxID=1127 RepID=UPI00391CB289